MFQQTNPQFFEELSADIKGRKVNQIVDLIYGEVPLRKEDGSFWTPRIIGSSKQIEVHETFLSFVWCAIYSTFVKYLETVDFPQTNNRQGKAAYTANQDHLETATQMFDYARSLIVDFQKWNIDVSPNPEKYLAENRDFIEQTTLYYNSAVKFILCHEYAHLKFEHLKNIDKNTDKSRFCEMEYEADNFAIDSIMKGYFEPAHFAAEAQRLANEIGVIFGIVVMFYFKASTEGAKHPNAEDRLTNALERLKLEDNHPGWGIACTGFKFWDSQFGKNLVWDIENKSFKELYYQLLDQIKKEN
ncbi:phage exclusion protein Lit family protein [Flavobacterium sp.]|uniref:phage exclusion protein Lit family protein n=1 Tax=Flavobacterium sp. TaxID=239 RepID=UPI002EDB5A0B